MNTLKKRAYHTLLTGIYMVSLCTGPAFLKAEDVPVAVVDTTWQAVQENSSATVQNIWGAVTNLASYIPGTCKQITYETKVLSQAFTQCPLATAVVLSAATYGAWKTYNWLKGNAKVNAIVARGRNAGNRVYQYAVV